MTTTLRIRSAADVLALIPYTFGFHPEDSLVAIVLDSGRNPFQARVDLPDDPGALADVVDQLVHAATVNGGDQVILVAYSTDECLAEAATELVACGYRAAGLEVVLMLRADGSYWYPIPAEEPGSSHGVPYDVRSHELTSRSVLDGRVTFRNREELAGSLAAADPDLVEEVASAYSRLTPLAEDAVALAAEGRWLVTQVRAAVTGEVTLGPVALGRLLRAVQHRDVRDLAWCEITREQAGGHVRLWREVVRQSPEELLAPPSGLLAFAAWLSGEGALAWCAVERSLRADPDHTLAHLVAQALEAAMPPSTWRPMDPGSLRLRAG